MCSRIPCEPGRQSCINLCVLHRKKLLYSPTHLLIKSLTTSIFVETQIVSLIWRQSFHQPHSVTLILDCFTLTTDLTIKRFGNFIITWPSLNLTLWKDFGEILPSRDCNVFVWSGNFDSAEVCFKCIWRVNVPQVILI